MCIRDGNIPEGLAVAVALRGEGYSARKAWVVAALTGLVEPVGGFVGAGIVSFSHQMMPWGLAFAAGAMLYVISHEIYPATYRNGNQNRDTLGREGGREDCSYPNPTATKLLPM